MTQRNTKPRYFTDEEARTYIALRDEGMSVKDAQHAAMQPVAKKV